MFFTLCKSCDYLLKYALPQSSRAKQYNSQRFYAFTAHFSFFRQADPLSNQSSHVCPKRHKTEKLITTSHPRYYGSKRESYFSAIGGDTDEPPPDLTPSQVTTILRKNEKQIVNNFKVVKSIECNQLASNHPVEDRIRVARLQLNDETETLAFCVFDGHGGSACAHVVSKRLFYYLTMSLLENPSEKIKENDISSFVEDLHTCPNSNLESSHQYDSQSLERIRQVLHHQEQKCVSRYADDLIQNDIVDIKDKIKRAFTRLDDDLSKEIESTLTSRPVSNAVLHYYLSLAVSGCCVSLVLLHGQKIYVANTGDCRAVLGLRLENKFSEKPAIKCVTLTNDHNSDNISEIKRLFATHPPNEHNNIIRNNRLLGHLMPFRAFGDYCYKWPVDKMKRTGLIRAFGPHIIPPHYFTPPYLISEPEVQELEIPNEDVIECFLIVATDGLWEQFESSRNVVKQVVKQSMRLVSSSEAVETNAENFNQLHNCFLEEAIDENVATYLIRRALSISPTIADPHEDKQHRLLDQHKRIVTFLTLPESVVRSFRDDISVIVSKFK